MPGKLTDNASTTLKVVNKQLPKLKIKLVRNYNIPEKHLSNHGVHLNQQGMARLVMNFIFYMNKM